MCTKVIFSSQQTDYLQKSFTGLHTLPESIRQYGTGIIPRKISLQKDHTNIQYELEDRLIDTQQFRVVLIFDSSSKGTNYGLPRFRSQMLLQAIGGVIDNYLWRCVLA